jgi:cell division protein FtsN
VQSTGTSPKVTFFFGGLIGFVAGVVLAGVLAIWIYQSLPYRPEVNPSARSDARPKTPAAKPAETGQQVVAKEEGKSDAQRIVPPPAVVAPGGTNPAAKPSLEPEAAKSGKADGKTADAATPPPASAEPSPSAEARGRLWLQVGSYAQRGDAEAQRAKFAVMGYEAQVQVAEVPDKGTLHRVRIGPFRDPDEAARVRSDLARQGIEVSVVRPSAN